MIQYKIVLAIHSLQAGGMERVMSELALHFSRKTEIELHLILYGIYRDVFYDIPENIVIYRPDFAFNNKRRYWSTIRTLYFLRSTVKSIDPVTILSFGEYWNSFVLISLLGTNYPVYISDRAQPGKSSSWKTNLFRRWLYPRAAGIIAQTQKAKEIYPGLFTQPNVKVIGNPIRKIENITNAYERENIVLMVGRLIKSKNQDVLIKIFADINNPDWKLVLVGYDHLKQKNQEKLEVLIKELDLTDRVYLAGKQSDVDKYYLKSKIFAFTSSSEGFPNVIGEAMSAGLPVIAYDCVAGPSEMIEDNVNGFLIPPEDNVQFKQKLSILMKDSSLRAQLGVQGKNDIKAFSLDNIGEQYFNFITDNKANTLN